MASIRHHLTLAEACLVNARGHLEAAFEHAIDQHYDSRWTAAIDLTITETEATTSQVHNIKTLIEPPCAPGGLPACNLSTPHGD